MSNRIELTGFTSKDGAELRVTPSGVTVTTFRMSGTHQRYDQNQAKYVDQGDALWYGVECWRELAEQVAEQIGTGTSRRVTVTGHLERRSYTTNDGQERTVDEVKADSVCVHPERNRSNAPRQSGQQSGGWGGQQQPAQGQPSTDPWANGGQGQQQGGGGWMPAGVNNDEPPFEA